MGLGNVKSIECMRGTVVGGDCFRGFLVSSVGRYVSLCLGRSLSDRSLNRDRASKGVDLGFINYGKRVYSFLCCVCRSLNSKANTNIVDAAELLVCSRFLGEYLAVGSLFDSRVGTLRVIGDRVSLSRCRDGTSFLPSGFCFCSGGVIFIFPGCDVKCNCRNSISVSIDVSRFEPVLSSGLGFTLGNGWWGGVCVGISICFFFLFRFYCSPIHLVDGGEEVVLKLVLVLHELIPLVEW